MIFGREGDAYVPTGHAVGPWDPGQLHGGGPSALLAREVERLAPGMHLTRLTVEFLGAVPLAPVRVRAEIVKSGRRFQLAEAALSVEGRDVLRARAVLLRSSEPLDVPGGAPPVPLEHGPQDGEPAVWPSRGGEQGFHLTGMEIRFTGSSFGETGPAVAWFRLAHPLVEGEEPSPVQRAVAAADFGNGVSRELDWSQWLFINTDLSVHLHRPPHGDWVAIDAHTVIDPAGIGVASSVLHDERGAIGAAHQSLFVGARS